MHVRNLPEEKVHWSTSLCIRRLSYCCYLGCVVMHASEHFSLCKHFYPCCHWQHDIPQLQSHLSQRYWCPSLLHQLKTWLYVDEYELKLFQHAKYSETQGCMMSVVLFVTELACREMWWSQIVNDSCLFLTLLSTEGMRQTYCGKVVEDTSSPAAFPLCCCCSLLNLISPVHLLDREYLA